jgi:hypothetical protein
MEHVIDHKWTVLLLSEGFYCAASIGFLLFKYWFHFKKLSQLFFGLFILGDIWIAALGLFDYSDSKQFSYYQMVVLIIILYALIFGKKELKQLDQKMHIWISKWKKTSHSSFDGANREDEK